VTLNEVNSLRLAWCFHVHSATPVILQRKSPLVFS